MPNQYKLLIFAALFIAVWLMFKPQPNNEVQQIEPKQVTETVEIPLNSIKQSNKTATTTKQQPTLTDTQHLANCIPRSQYDQDSRHQAVEHYIKNEYLGRHVDHFNYMNEEELYQRATEGSPRAMLLLGLNYRWNARMENFRAESIRPPEQPKPKYVARKYLNGRIMNKARFWLLEAAAHGQLVALAEIAVSYEHQAYQTEINNPEDVEAIVQLRLYAQSYRQLHHQQAPQLSNLDDEDPIEPQYLAQLETIYTNIQSSWQNRREQLGLPSQIELHLPPEFEQLAQLAQNLCEELQ